MQHCVAYLVLPLAMLIGWNATAAPVDLEAPSSQPSHDRALVAACKARDAEAVLAALKAGADPNTMYDEERKQTCVHFGAAENTAILAHLLKHGGDADAQDVNGYAPLHIAAITGNADAVSVLLILTKPNVDLRDADLEQTPLHVAALQGRAQIAYYLLKEGGADPNAQMRLGRTPLHIAAQHGNKATVWVLLANGGDRTLRDEEGMTALDYARRRGHEPIIKLLEADEVPPLPEEDE